MQAKFSLSRKEIPPYSNKMCVHQPQAIMDFFMLDILIFPMRFQHEIFAILVKSHYCLCSIASKISRALYWAKTHWLALTCRGWLKNKVEKKMWRCLYCWLYLLALFRYTYCKSQNPISTLLYQFILHVSWCEKKITFAIIISKSLYFLIWHDRDKEEAKKIINLEPIWWTWSTESYFAFKLSGLFDKRSQYTSQGQSEWLYAWRGHAKWGYYYNQVPQEGRYWWFTRYRYWGKLFSIAILYWGIHRWPSWPPTNYIIAGGICGVAAQNQQNYDVLTHITADI